MHEYMMLIIFPLLFLQRLKDLGNDSQGGLLIVKSLPVKKQKWFCIEMSEKQMKISSKT